MTAARTAARTASCELVVVSDRGAATELDRRCFEEFASFVGLDCVDGGLRTGLPASAGFLALELRLWDLLSGVLEAFSTVLEGLEVLLLLAEGSCLFSLFRLKGLAGVLKDEGGAEGLRSAFAWMGTLRSSSFLPASETRLCLAASIRSSVVLAVVGFRAEGCLVGDTSLLLGAGYSLGTLLLLMISTAFALQYLITTYLRGIST